MKFRKSGQVLLAAATVAVGLGMTSCGESHTSDYLYVTSNKNTPGQINVYQIDSKSGAAIQISDSPYSSGGNNPVAEIASQNGNDLYVANRDSNTVVTFTVGSDAKLSQAHSCTTPGAEPSSMAISSDGTLLFVVDFYQSGYSDTKPGPGELVVYNIQSDGTLGTASGNCTPVANGSLSYWPLGFYPGTVTTVSTTYTPINNTGSETSTLYPYVYVTDTNSYITTTTPPTNNTPPPPTGLQGQIYAFGIGTGGVLSTVSGSPFTAGATPTGLAIDPTGRFLYATDSEQNQVIGYTIGASGVLTAVPSGPGTTGTFPVSAVVDPTGFYLYITNYNSASVSEFAIDQGTGAPTAAAASSISTDAGATDILIDPALGRYVFTANFTGGDISSLTLNPNTGALSSNQNSPFPTAGQPTAVAAIPHGNHATTHVQSGAGD
jgi:6-phosphogluconolactonase